MLESVSSRQSLTQRLITENAHSFVEAFQVQHIPILRGMLYAAMHIPARNIAKTILDYDASVHSSSLAEGSRWFLNAFDTQVQAYHSERIPQNVPVLFVSNHPGMTDAMAIFATLPRYDVQVVARANPILPLLRGFQQHIIYVQPNINTRISTVRAITRQLRARQSVLLFPRGTIEPDPTVYPNAVDELSQWSASLELFMQRIPQLQIVPIVVGGVISNAARRNPLVSLYQTQTRREWVAATLMVLMPAYRPVCVTVRYGHPISATTPNVMDAVTTQMREMMAETYNNLSLLSPVQSG